MPALLHGQREVQMERLAAASAASEAMAMMLRLQREKAEVQMELRQFRHFADEKMALDAADIDQLRALLAQRAPRLVCLRGRLREYRLQFLHLGIPLPEGEGEDLVAQSAAEEEEDLLLLDGDGGYYPKLRCNDGEYYYEDGQEEEDAVALDLEGGAERTDGDPHASGSAASSLRQLKSWRTREWTIEDLKNGDASGVPVFALAGTCYCKKHWLRRKWRGSSAKATSDSSVSRSSDEMNDANSDGCHLCSLDGNLLCCDGCPAAFHLKCVGLVEDLLPESD